MTKLLNQEWISKEVKEEDWERYLIRSTADKIHDDQENQRVDELMLCFIVCFMGVPYLLLGTLLIFSGAFSEIFK